MTYLESLTDKGLTEFQCKLAYLDAGLTEKGNQCFHTARQANRNPQEFMFGNNDCYYLSDGGYSRIGFSSLGLDEVSQKAKIFLTSNSTDKVKEAWFRCKELIKDVEDILQKYLDSI